VQWTEIDARFPEPPPVREAPERFSPALRLHVTALATRATRIALGFAAKPIERAELGAVIAAVSDDRFVLRDPLLSGLLALVAAIEKDWDGVATCTGKRTLGSRVASEKTFGEDVTGLARHLATAARAQLPARQVMPAMQEVRERFAAGTLADARVAVLAARLFVGDVVAAPDVVATTRAWLAGEEIEIVETAKAPVRAVADGEDPRIKIFERYADELGDDAAIDRGLALLDSVDQEPWHRYLERQRVEIEDAVIRAWMARRRLPENWEALVDPVVANWLGCESRAQLSLDERLRDLARRGYVSTKVPRGEWERPAEGLGTGEVRGVREAPPFKPGKFFKDDGRKLLEYIATALVVGAKAEDVEPAWLDFLARRSPATTPRIEEGTLHWKHLLAIQCALTHRLGKEPREATGAALQRIVTGV
jgi:hypothetical protein